LADIFTGSCGGRTFNHICTYELKFFAWFIDAYHPYVKDVGVLEEDTFNA
jgi:hypothetical protein